MRQSAKKTYQLLDDGEIITPLRWWPYFFEDV